MKINLMLFFTALLLMTASCKKNKDTVTIVGKWKQSSGIYSPAYLGESDYFSAYSPCEKDDIVEFKSDNTYELNEGASKCDPASPQIIVAGSYTVNADLTSIVIIGQTTKIAVTSNTLTVNNTFSQAGVTYSDISVYQRQ
jgi:hypothetical protein